MAMTVFHSALFLYSAVVLLGLLSALVARVSEGSRHQTLCQCAFLVCLALVGATAIITLAGSPGVWLGAGATFSVMVVVVTCDFSRCRRAAAYTS